MAHYGGIANLGYIGQNEKENENKIMWLENLQGAEISYRLVQK